MPLYIPKPTMITDRIKIPVAIPVETPRVVATVPMIEAKNAVRAVMVYLPVRLRLEGTHRE